MPTSTQSWPRHRRDIDQNDIGDAAEAVRGGTVSFFFCFGDFFSFFYAPFNITYGLVVGVDEYFVW